jgi:ankyrin repeat protein
VQYSEPQAIQLIQQLLAKQAQQNLGDSFDNTPLHLAIKKDRYQIAIFLINNKANLARKNNHGETSPCIY